MRITHNPTRLETPGPFPAIILCESAQRQRRFSSDVSHQLRTPLTILIGQIEVALRQDRREDEYRRVLRSALAKASLLGQIVDALLFLGRADCDAQLPDSERLDLGLWVADYLIEHRAHAGAANIVQHSLTSESVPVRAHRPLLCQLLDNLLDNACKYGQPGSPILVETFRDGDAAILAVEDAGSGIASNELTRIFEPFYRSAAGRRQKKRGRGRAWTGDREAHRNSVRRNRGRAERRRCEIAL